jgi:hypothetical protein
MSLVLNLKWISDKVACCEPINDLKKNHKHYILYLFKSGHPPVDSAGICLFHEGWTERFLIHRLGIGPSKVV